MAFDDDDFDINDQELSPEEEKEINEQMKREREAVKKHPLNMQANEIVLVLESLVGIDKVKDDEAGSHAHLLFESIHIIRAKLRSALGSQNYLVCMQNASIIRDHAEYLRLSNHHLNHLDFDKAYVAVFREEMEKFRELFKLWIVEVKKMDREDFEDEWGLF